MSCSNVPMKMPVAKFPTCAGWLRRSSSAGGLLNQPSVVSSATSAPSAGVHHQQLPKATTTKKTGPGGNFGYAGTPDSHCIQMAIAQAARPTTVNFVSAVRFSFSKDENRMANISQTAIKLIAAPPVSTLLAQSAVELFVTDLCCQWRERPLAFNPPPRHQNRLWPFGPFRGRARREPFGA